MIFHKLEIWLYIKTPTRISQKLTNHLKKLDFGREKSNLIQKFDFSYNNIKKTECPKMTSKVLYELLLTNYEQFLIFSRTWNLTLHKNTSKDQPKTNQPSKINWISAEKRATYQGFGFRKSEKIYHRSCFWKPNYGSPYLDEMERGSKIVKWTFVGQLRYSLQAFREKYRKLTILISRIISFI